MIEGQYQMVLWVMVSTKSPTPIHDTMWNKFYKFLWRCKKVKKWSWSKQQVLCTTSSSYLTVEIHDPRSMSNGSMSNGVHKVAPIHGTMWDHSKFFVTYQKGLEKVKIKSTGFVHNFIILSNCWSLDRRSKSKVKRFNELWCPQKCFGRTDGQYYQFPTGVPRGTIKI